MTETLVAKGKVYLVGAGPGAPGLLTIEASRLLQTADVVFHRSSGFSGSGDPVSDKHRL